MQRMLLILQEIFERIIYTDDRLKYGVGNAALEKVIVELGKKEYHSKTWKHASYGVLIFSRTMT